MSSLTLVDADTFQPISQYNPIANGATINRATLPTQNLTIQANTSPATVGSVAFDLVNSGYLNTVNTAPYDLCGTAPCSNLGVGAYSLTTTPYMGSSGSGGAGKSMSISFSVVDPTPTPISTPTPTPSPTPTPVGCTHIPGTSTAVGAACFSLSSCPTLNSPQDPVTYGADKTGTSDSGSAFTSALAAGDLYISEPGTYLVNGSGQGGLRPPAGRQIQCAPGVTLKTTNEGSHDNGIFMVVNNNNTICGCNFVGPNSACNTAACATGDNLGNFLIEVAGGTGVKIEGSTFSNVYADSAIQFNEDSGTPSSGGLVQFNTFSANPYYGPEIDQGSNITFQNNLSTDGPIGVEDDQCATAGAPTGVLIQNNMLQVSVGDCRAAGDTSCDGTVFITGGDSPSGCNYSSETVRTNYCVGNSIQHAGIENTAPSSGSAASYSGNLLGSDCVCTSGAGSC